MSVVRVGSYCVKKAHDLSNAHSPYLCKHSGKYIALTLRAVEIAVGRAQSCIIESFFAVKVISARTAAEKSIRFDLSHGYINSAEYIDNRNESSEINLEISVDEKPKLPRKRH